MAAETKKMSSRSSLDTAAVLWPRSPRKRTAVSNDPGQVVVVVIFYTLGSKDPEG